MMPAHNGNHREPSEQTVQQAVYEALRDRILSGGVEPGKPVSLRRLAGELNVSPMPVRGALNRLIAERALVRQDNRRIYVPTLNAERYGEIVMARTLLEPTAIRYAFPQYSEHIADDLAAIDDRIDQALDKGDIDGYIAGNRAFHFSLYGEGANVLVPLIESLWLQFSPYMRIVYGRIGTTMLTDYHREAIKAVAACDVDALVAAITADIEQGMEHLRDVLALKASKLVDKT